MLLDILGSYKQILKVVFLKICSLLGILVPGEAKIHLTLVTLSGGLKTVPEWVRSLM